MKRWLQPGSRSRRVALAVCVYAVVVGIYFAVVPRYRILEHTPFNHFALLAEAWLDGRVHLDGSPPGYAQNNDFAKVGGKWFVAFPPFPALVLVPVVAIAGSAANVRDGQIFLWLSGVAPAVLFLALERLRAAGMSSRPERQNLVLSMLFAFGTVYFFTALQGTVWFAAHVVGAALAALYLLFAIDAERPFLAGLMIGLGFMTRTPLLFAFPLFAFEAVRVALRPSDETPAASPARRFVAFARRLDVKRIFKSHVLFALPILIVIGAALWLNQKRFGDPFDFGYEHLTVAWASRMKKWGLFDYHFLARNLGVVLTSLPWVDWTAKPPVQINAHGLALWFTTPLYLWLVWPKRVDAFGAALYATVVVVAVPTLFYQNTGWIQFGYRFSNDYAVFLFALLAVTGRRFGGLFAAAALWSVAINAFGAATFDRGALKRFYHEDRSQKILYQPD